MFDLANDPHETRNLWDSTLHKKILAKGKNLVIEVRPEDVKPLIRELGPDRILLQTICRSEEEVSQLLGANH